MQQLDIVKLSREEERILFEKQRQGDCDAHNQLIISHLPLVISIAKKHVGGGLEMDDLIQEGCVGLMIAIDKFDIAKNTRFSTYATWYIFREIIRNSINKGRLIRLPESKITDLNSLKKIRNLLVEEKKQEVTNEEIYEHGDLSQSEQKTLKEINFLPMRQVELELMDLENKFFYEGVEEQAVYNVLIDELEKAFVELNKEEKKVLKLRYGFEDKPQSRYKMQDKLGITRPRLKTIEENGLEKIRKKMGV